MATNRRGRWTELSAFGQARGLGSRSAASRPTQAWRSRVPFAHVPVYASLWFSMAGSGVCAVWAAECVVEFGAEFQATLEYAGHSTAEAEASATALMTQLESTILAFWSWG